MKSPGRILLQVLALNLLTVLALCGSAAAIDDTEMVTVQAGYFWMGCNNNLDPDCYESEKPFHRVWLPEYEIDKYEVTFRRYKECMKNGPCKMPGIGGACNYGMDGVDQFPVNCVTWRQARIFCDWDDRRLPTEAEWEKAARGTTHRLYPWGNQTPSCNYAAMDNPNAGNLGCGTGTTLGVGSKPLGASPYGAEDMAGNLWEWTADWYGHYYYSYSTGYDPKGPLTGTYRVARGGDIYARRPATMRTATRFPYAPQDYSIAVGFRCAR